MGGTDSILGCSTAPSTFVEFGYGGGRAGSLARRPVVTPLSAGDLTTLSMSSLKTQQGVLPVQLPPGPKGAVARVKFCVKPGGSKDSRSR